MATTE
jgi:hypothetical protein